MSKFFDVQKQTLHIVTSYAGAVKLADKLITAEKVTEYSDDITLCLPAKLRRCRAVHGDQVFFSTIDKSLLRGSYDLSDKSNQDLVEVTNTVIYR